MVALPGYRSRRPAADILKHGLLYCSLWYRAPEILMGDANFAFPADLWSLVGPANVGSGPGGQMETIAN